MSVGEFLAWEPGDGLRYELVDGQPRAMGGARAKHARIVINAIMALRARLTGGPCEPFTDDLAVLTPKGNLRRPDVTVDCGDPDPEKQVADRPVLVIEVLSDSTRKLDTQFKVIEYKALPTLRAILLLDPDDYAALLYARETGGSDWREIALIGPDTVVPLASLDLSFPLATFYADVL
ncbi:Uma2 family endonuclease [Prosthecodimorpha hirschii]|uniref:Uma2 family endonuclease n=1 Tax=Prosthecodimorpha hirschii TaxID=665126 RepID=UPI0015E3568A|nr:Uma2 family endonuclease [Prosthecomicrobium hirschii]